tara:strand:- start:225 stop:476 length:252 start_codon:yes stop_codon:yes gene_type:complete
MEFIKVEKDIWKLQDGSIFEGSANELPKSNASKIAKAGMEYKKEYLEGQGWGAKKKEAAPKKKAAAKKAPETKAVKPEDLEDK